MFNIRRTGRLPPTGGDIAHYKHLAVFSFYWTKPLCPFAPFVLCGKKGTKRAPKHQEICHKRCETAIDTCFRLKINGKLFFLFDAIIDKCL